MIIIPRPWFLYCKIEVWILTTYPILRKGFWEAKYSPLKHTWWLPIFNTWIMLCLLRPFLFIHQLTITFTIYNRKLTLLRKFWSCFKRTVSVHVDFWPLFFVFLQWEIFTWVSIGEKSKQVAWFAIRICLLRNFNSDFTTLLMLVFQNSLKKKTTNQIGPNLDDKFREKGEGMKKRPTLLSLSLEINH